jgi:hypothetical protein
MKPILLCLLALACAESASASPGDAVPESIDPAKWFASRGVPASRVAKEFDGGKVNREDCHELLVGPAREEALACDESTQGGGWITFRGESRIEYWWSRHRVIRVARARKIKTVLDVQVSLRGDDTGFPRLVLQLSFSADGSSAKLEDLGIVVDGPGDAKISPDERCGADDHDFTIRLCKGRSVFTWRGGRYVRTRRAAT